MRFDTENCALKFASIDEAQRLHRELTEMIRELIATAHQGLDSVDEAKDRSKTIFQRYSRTMSVLNSLRGGLPRQRDDPST